VRGPKLTQALVLLGVALFAGVLLFVRPADESLSPHEFDESYYALLSLRLADAETSWLLPRHRGGAPAADKPPLFAWIQATSIRIAGFNVAALRVPSALAAWGAILICSLAAMRIAGADAGLCAGLILASTPQLYTPHGVWYGVLEGGALLLTTAILAQSLAILRRIEPPETSDDSTPPSAGPTAAQGMALGALLGLLAMFKSGLVILPVAVLLGWAALRRGREAEALVRGSGGVVAAALLVSVPWYGFALAAGEGQYLSGIWGVEVLGRVAGIDTMSPRPLHYMPERIFAGLGVWSWPALVLVPWGLWTAPRTMRRPLAFAGLWAAATVLLFSLSRTQWPWYGIPTYPALAIVMGVALARAARRPRGRRVAVAAGIALAIGFGFENVDLATGAFGRIGRPELDGLSIAVQPPRWLADAAPGARAGGVAALGAIALAVALGVRLGERRRRRFWSMAPLGVVAALAAVSGLRVAGAARRIDTAQTESLGSAFFSRAQGVWDFSDQRLPEIPEWWRVELELLESRRPRAAVPVHLEVQVPRPEQATWTPFFAATGLWFHGVEAPVLDGARVAVEVFDLRPGWTAEPSWHRTELVPVGGGRFEGRIETRLGKGEALRYRFVHSPDGGETWLPELGGCVRTLRHDAGGTEVELVLQHQFGAPLVPSAASPWIAGLSCREVGARQYSREAAETELPRWRERDARRSIAQVAVPPPHQIRRLFAALDSPDVPQKEAATDALEASARSEDQGCAMREMLEHAVTGDAVTRALAAAVVLGRLGPLGRDAIERLVDVIGDRRPGMTLASLWALEQIGWDPGDHLAGLLPVVSHGGGSDSRPLLIALDRALQADDRRPGSRAEAVEAIVALLDRYEERSIPTAAWVLGRLGNDAEPALAALLDCLRISDWPTAVYCAHAIHAIAPQRAVSIFSDLVEDLNAPIRDRVNAVRALGLLGRDAMPALPVLLAAVVAPQPELEEAAARACGRLGPRATRRLRALARTSALRVSAHLVSVLDARGAFEAGDADVLETILRQGDDAARAAAARALGGLRSAAAGAVPVLARTLEQADDPALRRAATEALGRIGSVEALPALLAVLSRRALEAPAGAKDFEALRDSDRLLRVEAARACAALGTGAEAALPHLEAMLHDRSAEVRRAAAGALRRVRDQALAAPSAATRS